MNNSIFVRYYINTQILPARAEKYISKMPDNVPDKIQGSVRKAQTKRQANITMKNNGFDALKVD